MQTITREIVGAVIISKDNKILQVFKHAEGVYSDCWHIPGGGVDGSEDKITALKREIYEETGIEISEYPIELVDHVDYGESEKTLDNGEKVLIKMNFNNYRVFINDKNSYEIGVILDSSELTDYKWVSFDELKDLKITPPSVKLFKKMGYLK
jgi:8-oxo-dGTP pyrophosphatase MutT (NUDIX family)